MASIEVTIIKRGDRFTTERPLYSGSGIFAIVYKRKKWQVDGRRVLDLRSAKPLPETIDLDFATEAEARKLAGSRTSPPEARHMRISTPGHPAPPPPPMAPAEPVTAPKGPGVPRRTPGWRELDPAQMKVVRSEPEARLLIDAGPGTGKTAVACARVAWLAEEKGVPAAQIWLVSFSRTAVEEIRARIAGMAGPQIANAVQVATIDSMAGQLNRGPGAARARNFDENIRLLFDELDTNWSVKEYLDGVRHLVVDEAQDIVADRADLIEKLVGRVPHQCGVSIFFDLAQSIYGFAKGDAAGAGAGTNRAPADRCLAERMTQPVTAKGFTSYSLVDVHRTSDARLKELFTSVRTELLDRNLDSKARENRIRTRLRELAHSDADKDIRKAVVDLPEDSFILFRTRLAALMAAAHLDGTDHRLRISGLPIVIAPWIAATLGQAEETEVGQRTFRNLWSEKITGSELATIDADAAFDILLRFAPTRVGSRVDLDLLRRKLATRPGKALSSPDIGTKGPVIGTIHASKGREADTVIVSVPPPAKQDPGDEAREEETRVLFVGATRAKRELRVAEGFNLFASATGAGRAYRFRLKDKPRCELEVGRAGDLTAAGIAGQDYFESAEVGSSRVDLQACKLEYSIVSPK